MRKRIHHPEVCDLGLKFTDTELPDSPGWVFCSYSTDAGCFCNERMRLLGSLAATTVEDSARATQEREAADEIAKAHDVAMPTVSIAWLLAKPTVVSPIASARVTRQLKALQAGMTIELSVDELDRLDAESARIPA